MNLLLCMILWKSKIGYAEGIKTNLLKQRSTRLSSLLATEKRVPWEWRWFAWRFELVCLCQLFSDGICSKVAQKRLIRSRREALGFILDEYVFFLLRIISSILCSPSIFLYSIHQPPIDRNPLPQTSSDWTKLYVKILERICRVALNFVVFNFCDFCGVLFHDP